MQTTVTDNELDTSELDGMVQEAENQVAALQSQIKALEDENAALLKKISESSVEDAAVYRQQYNANQTRIQELKSELAEWQQKTGRLRKRKIGGCRRQCRGDGRLLPHPGHHAGLQDRLQPDVAGRRSMERLHLRGARPP